MKLLGALMRRDSTPRRRVGGTPTDGGPTAHPTRQPLRTVITYVTLAALLLLVGECLHVFVGNNFHCVAAGKCYRSAQPSARFLRYAQADYGIRSIINLRDENKDDDWYQEERQAAERLGIKLIDAGLRGIEQTPEDDFRRCVQAIADSPEPILIHCASGSDRSGLASAIYLLLRTDTPLEEARRQLHLRYGHFSWSRASCLERTLEGYVGWLRQNGLSHQPEHFLNWARNVYRPESGSS